MHCNSFPIKLYTISSRLFYKFNIFHGHLTVNFIFKFNNKRIDQKQQPVLLLLIKLHVSAFDCI